MQFKEIARECGALLIEVALVCPVDEAIERCIDRGKKSGYINGFRPGGILESEGGARKLRSMYTEMTALLASRSEVHFIDSIQGKPDETYQLLLDSISKIP